MKKCIVAKGRKFSSYALKFVGISNRNRVQATEAKYSISILFKVEKKMLLYKLAQVILLHVKEEKPDRR
jgi:hypothetical protein